MMQAQKIDTPMANSCHNSTLLTLASQIHTALTVNTTATNKHVTDTNKQHGHNHTVWIRMSVITKDTSDTPTRNERQTGVLTQTTLLTFE